MTLPILKMVYRIARIRTKAVKKALVRTMTEDEINEAEQQLEEIKMYYGTKSLN